MSTFNYTRERPAESTFSDIQSLNKFTDAVIVHIWHLVYIMYKRWQ